MQCGPHAFFLFFLLNACASSGQGPAPRAPVAKEAAAVHAYLTGEQLSVWPSVDTADEFNQEAIACLRRFFEKKMHPDAVNDFWSQADVERYVYPFADLLYLEYDNTGQVKYLPTVMKIAPVAPETRRVAVKWAATDSTGTAADVRYVFDFIATKTADGVRLAQPVEYNTRNWQRVQFGDVRYIVSPQHRFDRAEADQQAKDIRRLAAFFGVAPFPITFYSCKDPADLFTTRGFELHPLLFVHPTGGMVDHGEHVFSGNDRDIYTHEIAHLFSKRRFGERPDLLEEGLATLLGGSNDRPYAWHRANLKRYLDAAPDAKLAERCNPYVQDFVGSDTNVPYVIGAILCERILREGGKAGLFAVLEGGTDPWPALGKLGVTKADLDRVVREELAKEMVEP